MQEIPRYVLIEASNGDMEAFEMIYKAASDFVYTIAVRMTNNIQDAQEVTQDVFVKIYKNLKGFEFRSSFKSWIYRIAVNASIDMCNRRAKEKKRLLRQDDGMGIEEIPEPTAEKTDREDKKELAASLLDVLIPRYRACIILRNIEGLSYKEIAETLGININTVRSRLFRAREVLSAVVKRGDR